MRVLLSFILGMLISSAAIGQGEKLEGTVRDAGTGEPLVGVSVMLYQKGVLVKGAITDLKGYFFFQAIAQEDFDIEFRANGFNILRMPIKHKRGYRLDVNLNPIVDIPGPGLVIWVRPPLIDISNTTQGHVFRMEDIRHSPIR